MTNIWQWITGEAITATKMNKLVNSSDYINATNILGIALPDNNASAFEIKEATNSYIKIDTTNGTEKITLGGTEGSETLILDGVASAVNEITLVNAATGNNPVISATGGDTDIGITLTTKGAAG